MHRSFSLSIGNSKIIVFHKKSPLDLCKKEGRVAANALIQAFACALGQTGSDLPASCAYS